eukprot:g1522.t1
MALSMRTERALEISKPFFANKRSSTGGRRDYFLTCANDSNHSDVTIIITINYIMPYLDIDTGQFRDDDDCVLPEPDVETLHEESTKSFGMPAARKIEEEDEEEEEEGAARPLNVPHILKGKEVEKFEGRKFVAGLIHAVNKAKVEMDRPEEPAEPFYWEESRRANASETTAWDRIRDHARWMGSGLLCGAQYVGDVVIAFFGMNEPYYQWAADHVEKERRIRDLEAKQKQRGEARRKKLRDEARQKLDEAEDKILREKASRLEES